MDTVIRTFQTLDYVVFAGLFVISSGIGVFFAVKQRKTASSREFLVGGRGMTCVPVALSLTASFMSAVTVLGTPSDVYRFGSSFFIFSIAYTFVVILTAEIFVPVFYRSGITSTYEYLQLRFCKTVRRAATLIYILQTILYTGVVVYAPALALNQVTGFNLWGSIFATGIVCTFYCTLGGLKAVVWTDAFQMVVMVVGFLTVLIQGSLKNGGIAVVLEKAHAGSRLDVLEFEGWRLTVVAHSFDPDPLRRHTFWTITVGGTFTWLGIYGVNQSTIQRCISCKTEGHAKMALYLNLLGLLLILLCTVFSGLMMFALYSQCDPWTAGYVKAPDQLMPYFVMEILCELPGLPGLFVACAFSGTLSTVAASINALATVTYEDFVRQCFTNLSDRASTWISKGLCVVYGVVCTTIAVTASYMGGIVQAALSIHGMCGGPMLGLFSLGILLPWTNSKGAAGGLILGIALSFWAGVGAFIYPAPADKTRPLPLSTKGCLTSNISFGGTTEATLLTTVLPSPNRSSLADSWYSMSYLYYSAVGYLGTVICGFLITLLTGPTPAKNVRSLLIRPICNLFCFWSEKYKRLCWCGLDHDQEKLDANLTLEENLPEYKNVERNFSEACDTSGRQRFQQKCDDLKGMADSSNLKNKSHTNSGFANDTLF